MKCVPFLLMAALLAGCASTTASREDLAQYGTPPSQDDLYQFMSQNRDTLPPTRYVSYRDEGYADSVEKVDYTSEQGQIRHGWKYDFDVATYDVVNDNPVVWTPRRAIFLNGRLIRLETRASHPGVTTPSSPSPARTSPAR